MAGDDRVRLAALQGDQEFIPWTHADVARRPDLVAQRSRQIDIKAAQDAVLVQVVERREVSFRQKPHHDPTRLFGAGGILSKRRVETDSRETEEANEGQELAEGPLATSGTELKPCTA
jgi:hypothetical protein